MYLIEALIRDFLKPQIVGQKTDSSIYEVGIRDTTIHAIYMFVETDIDLETSTLEKVLEIADFATIGNAFEELE